MSEGKTADVFGKSAMSRIASADELDHYVKVTNPSAWVVLVAALLLVVGIFVWAVFAVVPITVNTTGVRAPNSNTVICWVDESTANKIREGDAKATVENRDALSIEVSEVPMSASEVTSFLGSDFVKDSIAIEDWNYMVVLEMDGDLGEFGFTIDSSIGKVHPLPVSIVVSEKKPIVLVLGDR